MKARNSGINTQQSSQTNKAKSEEEFKQEGKTQGGNMRVK